MLSIKERLRHTHGLKAIIMQLECTSPISSGNGRQECLKLGKNVLEIFYRRKCEIFDFEGFMSIMLNLVSQKLQETQKKNSEDRAQLFFRSSV